MAGDRQGESNPAGLYLSVVVPFFNEEGNVRPLVEEVSRALSSSSRAWELVLVDDGSSDGGWQEAMECREDEPRLRLVQLEGNNGQSEAMVVGIGAAHGEVIATLDADLQNDPADIPRLLELVGEWDMVCGYRHKRRDTWIKRASSWIANTFRRMIVPDPVRDTGCSLKVFKKCCFEGAPFFRGSHRFLATIAHHGGWRVTEMAVNHRQRHAGATKYGTWDRLTRALPDLFGIRWLLSRRLRARIAEEVPPGTAA